MSFIGKTGPGFRSLVPVVWLTCLLLFSGSDALAQDEEVPAIEQNTEANVTPSESPQQISAAAGIPESEEAIAQGRQLFNGNCKVCHGITEVLVGPALGGVHERRPVDWIHAFIRNSQKVIQSGDAYAVNLYNEFNKTPMPPFNFSDDELNAILAYVKYETDNPAQAGPATAAGTGGETAAGGAGISSDFLTILVIALIGVLILILIILVLVVAVLNKYLSQRTDLDQDDKEIIKSNFKFGDILKSRAFIAFVIFLFVSILAKTLLDSLFLVGIQQGYQPEQPIAFSHKLHAGQYEINCNYCHTGVYKAKSANIPSVNICMNCHNTIKQDSPEIQKLYAAVENNQPIEWVRIHNLPDLAYFNHAQHVNVGGVECQTCHGPIQEMEVVYQHAELTMGWCINCHRETEVKAQGNEYYDKLVQLHDANTGQPFRVKDIGGLECSKCHY